MAHNGSAVDGPADGGIASPLPGARLALTLLLSINLFNYIDRQVLSAVLPSIEKDFFPSAAQAGQPGGEHENVKTKLGLLQTAFLVTYMVMAPVFGWLADRISRWRLIAVGVVIWSLASMASGLAPNYLALFITRCFVGIGEAAYGPAAPTILSDLYPVKIRGKVLAWFYMAIPVGSALGYELGGAASKITGDWRWAFYAVLPPGVILGLWCFFMRDPVRGQADPGAVTPHGGARLRDFLIFLRTPSYVLVTLGMAAMTFAMGGMGHWMPTYVSQTRQAESLEHANFLFGGIVVATGLFATLLGGIAGDRLRPRFGGSYFLVSGLSMLLGFPMILLVIKLPFPLAWIFVFLACFCLFFNTGPTNTILANVTHPAIRSSGFAVNIFVIHALGDAISPAVIGRIADTFSMDMGFFVVSLMVLLAGILWLWGTFYLKRDTELAPTRLNFLSKA
jgi:MFS family permease